MNGPSRYDIGISDEDYYDDRQQIEMGMEDLFYDDYDEEQRITMGMLDHDDIEHLAPIGELS